MNRKAGILLHPSSLPSAQGIGDLGPDCIQFLDFLKDCRQQLWQILPLGPTGYGNSPYQSFSAFAGNPHLIHTEELQELGLLTSADLKAPAWARRGAIDFSRLAGHKEAQLRKAFRSFLDRQNSPLWQEFEQFYTVEGWWLHDFALFMTIKASQDQRPWWEWPEDLKKRDTKSLEALNTGSQPEILFHKFCQFIFQRQWLKIRAAAEERQIQIIGDLPIFVAWDSADVWCWPHYFRLNSDGSLQVKTGVPPDYFSPTGQLWGNPHYDWSAMAADDYWWWRSRFHRLKSLVHTIRIDHFRGFESAWEVPRDAETAETGFWAKAPGHELFSVLHKTFHDLDLIAEDLGVITPEVEALKNAFHYPGLKILQFGALKGNENFLPHNYEKNCVAYTGTHDNDTLIGFVESESSEARQQLFSWLGITKMEALNAASTRALWASSANWVLLPMQDLLGLGSDARMNVPGSTENNWRWRLNKRYRNKKMESWLRGLTEIYQR